MYWKKGREIQHVTACKNKEKTYRTKALLYESHILLAMLQEIFYESLSEIVWTGRNDWNQESIIKSTMDLCRLHVICSSYPLLFP